MRNPMSNMTIREIADESGLKLETVRRLHADANKARRENTQNDRTMPAPEATGEGGALLWNRAAVAAWLERREAAPKRGGVPKSIVGQAIMELERGRKAAALRIQESRFVGQLQQFCGAARRKRTRAPGRAARDRTDRLGRSATGGGGCAWPPAR